MPVPVRTHLRRRPKRRKGQRVLYIDARTARAAKRHVERTRGGVVLRVRLADKAKVFGQKNYKVTMAHRLRRRKRR